ncbi:hypothetical protein E2C01_081792 [Portunus trituberculatus]|uniref:Uncharacterized protein n=1 Tax=Portunus trituberculatus TaxID=210409 RepID=A0A5B7J225_PORTR|nr:hypothetical protein [Portunus trituberculatus]
MHGFIVPCFPVREDKVISRTATPFLPCITVAPYTKSRRSLSSGALLDFLKRWETDLCKAACESLIDPGSVAETQLRPSKLGARALPIGPEVITTRRRDCVSGWRGVARCGGSRLYILAGLRDV